MCHQVQQTFAVVNVQLVVIDFRHLLFFGKWNADTVNGFRPSRHDLDTTSCFLEGERTMHLRSN